MTDRIKEIREQLAMHLNPNAIMFVRWKDADIARLLDRIEELEHNMNVLQGLLEVDNFDALPKCDTLDELMDYLDDRHGSALGGDMTDGKAKKRGDE